MNGESPFDFVLAQLGDVATETKFTETDGMEVLLVRFGSKNEVWNYFSESLDWYFCGPQSTRHYVQVDPEDRVLMADVDQSRDFAYIWFHGSQDFGPVEKATQLFRVIPSEESLAEVSKAMKRYKSNSDFVKIGLYRRTGPTRITE